MSRKYGVEIEFQGDRNAVFRSLEAAGVPARLIQSHEGFDPRRWTVKRDGSVSMGGELVSPPLDFDNPDDREQFFNAINALRDSGATPCPQAGIHVHIEGKQLDGRTKMTARQLAAIVRFTYKFEDAIYRIASSGWQTIRAGANSYATPIPESTARAIMDISKDSTLDELQRLWVNGEGRGRRYREVTRGRRNPAWDMARSRYTGTNLQAFFTKGTIEFRYFNSSVNSERIWCYVALCMAIVDDARHGFSRSTKKAYRVGAMLNGEVTEKAIMLRLQQVLRTNSKDSKVLMSKEDWKLFRKYWKNSQPQQSLSGRR